MAPLTLPAARSVRVWVARPMGHDGAARGRVQADQQRAIGRALLARALQAHWGLAPSEWQLTHTPTGAPRLVLTGTGQVLSCSFSHADGATLCAVGSAATLGVDLERVCQDDGHDRLARLVCSADEQAQLAACRRASLRSARFLGLWTLKEACAKALGGRALACVSLTRLSFDLGRQGSPADGAQSALSAARPGAAWQCHRFAVGLRHVAALAWQPHGPALQ